MNKKNVKGFVKEHKKGIQFATVMVLVGTVGFMLGRRQRAGTYIVNDAVEELILDQEEQYQGKNVVYTVKSREPIKPELLGELGKVILNNEEYKNETFQYFLAIGPCDKT